MNTEIVTVKETEEHNACIYKTGDCFEILTDLTQCPYMLMQFLPDGRPNVALALVCLSTGNRWSDEYINKPAATFQEIINLVKIDSSAKVRPIKFLKINYSV